MTRAPFVPGKNRHLKRAASIKAAAALRRGDLVPADACQDCGIVSDRIQGHHEDYADPLNLVWVCVKCHRRRHFVPIEGDYVAVNFEIDADLRRQLRIKVAKLGITKRVFIEDAIRAALKVAA